MVIMICVGSSKLLWDLISGKANKGETKTHVFENKYN